MKRKRIGAMKRMCRRQGYLPLAAAIWITLLGAGPEASAQDVPGDVTAGRVFAGKVCARCHNIRKNGDLSPLPEAPAFQAVADEPSVTQLGLRVFLQSPHRTMPDLHLTAQERDDIISYILSLKKTGN